MDGAHPNMKPAGGWMDREALSIIRSRVEPHKIDRKEKKVVKVHHFTYKSPLSFAESEELGIGQLRWYGPCLRCSVRAVGMTARKHAELPPPSILSLVTCLSLVIISSTSLHRSMGKYKLLDQDHLLVRPLL